MTKKIAPNELFSQKSIKFSCTCYPLSFCKILKEFVELIQSYQYVPFSVPKLPICPEQNFFGTNHYYYFHLLVGPFYCEKFTKNSYSGSKVMRMCHFWAQNAPFAPKNFVWKIILYHFKKILPELWGCTIFVPKMAHLPKWEIFFSNKLLMNLLPFIHAYLHAKNQSEILIY